MRPRDAVGEDERAGPCREDDVHGPLGEVLGDDGPQPFGERGLHRHQRLLDVLRRVLARGQEHVIVGVVGAGPLEDLEMDLLADLGLDSDGIFPGPSTHPVPPRRIIAFYCYTRRMRVLAVETSTLAGGVALLDGDILVGQYLLDVRVTHSERLMVAVDRLLGDAAWTVHDLRGLAVAVGPGSFTGLRVGLSAVKGLAVALRIPVAAVPTLDAMAASLPFAALPVCPVLDARKGEVYASLYRWDGRAMRREWKYQALTPESLAARLGEPVILLGDAAPAIRSPHARPARPSASSAISVSGRSPTSCTSRTSRSTRRSAAGGSPGCCWAESWTTPGSAGSASSCSRCARATLRRAGSTTPSASAWSGAVVAIITTPARTPSSWRPAWTGRAARPRRPGTR